MIMNVQGRAIERELDIFLGNKLRSYRERIGWSLADLGGRLGVSETHVQKYEHADSRISASMLYKLAQLFEIKPHSFYEGFQKSITTG